MWRVGSCHHRISRGARPCESMAPLVIVRNGTMRAARGRKGQHGGSHRGQRHKNEKGRRQEAMTGAPGHKPKPGSGAETGYRLWSGIVAAQRHHQPPPNHRELKKKVQRFREVVVTIRDEKPSSANEGRSQSLFELCDEAAKLASEIGPRVFNARDSRWALAWTSCRGILHEMFPSSLGLPRSTPRSHRRTSKAFDRVLNALSPAEQLDALTIFASSPAPWAPLAARIAITQYPMGGGWTPLHQAFEDAEWFTARVIVKHARALMSKEEFQTYVCATNFAGENLLHSRCFGRNKREFLAEILGGNEEFDAVARQMITVRSFSAGNPVQHRIIDLLGFMSGRRPPPNRLFDFSSDFIRWVGTLNLSAVERKEIVMRPASLSRPNDDGVLSVIHRSGDTILSDHAPGKLARSTEQYSAFDLALILASADIFEGLCALLDDDVIQCEEGWHLLESPNSNGWTPLHFAANAGHRMLTVYTDLLRRSKMPNDRLARLLVATTSRQPLPHLAGAPSESRHFGGQKRLTKSALHLAAGHADGSFELILDLVHAATPKWFAVLLRGHSSLISEDEYWHLLAGPTATTSVCHDLLRSGNAAGLQRWRSAVDTVDFPLPQMILGQWRRGRASQEGYDDLLSAVVEGGNVKCTAMFLEWVCDFFDDADHCTMLLSPQIHEKSRRRENLMVLAAQNEGIFKLLLQYCETVLERTRLYSPLWNLCTAADTLNGQNPVSVLLRQGCSPATFSRFYLFLAQAACGVWDDEKGEAAPSLLDLFTHSSNFTDGLTHAPSATVAQLVAAILAIDPGANSILGQLLFPTSSNQFDHPLGAVSSNPQNFSAVLSAYSSWLDNASACRADNEEEIPVLRAQRAVERQYRQLRPSGSASFFPTAHAEDETAEAVFKELSTCSLDELLRGFMATYKANPKHLGDFVQTLADESVWTRVVDFASASDVRDYLELCLRANDALPPERKALKSLRKGVLERAVQRGDAEVIRSVFEAVRYNGSLRLLLTIAIQRNHSNAIEELLQLYEASGRSDEIRQALVGRGPGDWILLEAARIETNSRSFVDCAAPLIARLRLLSEAELESALTRHKTNGYTFLHLACFHARFAESSAFVFSILDTLMELSPSALRAALHEPNSSGYLPGCGDVLNEVHSTRFEMMRNRTVPTTTFDGVDHTHTTVSTKPAWYIE